MSADRNFDALAERFNRQIYGTHKGKLRTELIREDLLRNIPWLDNTSARRHIIDAGGGTGLFSAQLVKNTSCTVTLCDISAQMLKHAQSNFAEIAPDTQVRTLHCPLQQLPEHTDSQGDLVLFHAVMEWLENPKDALEKLGRQVKPGGWFSVLFYNRQSLIWRHLMMGNFVYTNHPHARLKGNGKTLTPDNPLNPAEVEQWVSDMGFELHARTGIRSVYDNMRPHDRERSAFSDILAAEQIYGRQKPYIDLARYIHFLCRRPD